MNFSIALYKGTKTGMPGVYNRLVRWWERGSYSHCELIFSDGLSASASFMDHGVRFKRIEFDDHWDIVPLPAELEAPARAWFEEHNGESYDLMGNLHLVIGFFPEARRKKFCSEAVAAALGIDEAWRLGPSALATVLKWRYRQE